MRATPTPSMARTGRSGSRRRRARPGAAVIVRPPSSSGPSSGRRSARPRNRSPSAGAITPSASVRNLRDVVARARTAGRRADGHRRPRSRRRCTLPSASLISTRPPNAFSSGFTRVVAAGPFRVFDGRDLLPERDLSAACRTSSGAYHSLWCQKPSCRAAAKMYMSQWSSVSRLARGVVLLRIVGAAADHVWVWWLVCSTIDAMAAVAQLAVARSCELPGQVDPRLRLVLRGVLLGIGVENRALGLAGSGSGTS